MHNFFAPHLFVKYFLSLQLFVFSALWSPQPFKLPIFLVSKLFVPPKMSLVLLPPLPRYLTLRTGGAIELDPTKKTSSPVENLVKLTEGKNFSSLILQRSLLWDERGKVKHPPIRCSCSQSWPYLASHHPQGGGAAAQGGAGYHPFQSNLTLCLNIVKSRCPQYSSVPL